MESTYISAQKSSEGIIIIKQRMQRLFRPTNRSNENVRKSVIFIYAHVALRKGDPTHRRKERYLVVGG